VLKTFSGGIHPAGLKGSTVDKPIKDAPIPKESIIPLLQHTGAPCKAVVSPGAHVLRGQMIGDSDKFISSPVHAPVSGKVTKITDHPHPVLGDCRSVFIESDGRDEPDASIKERHDTGLLSDDQLRDIVKKSGVVGLGGAAFPTHVKLSIPAGKPVDSVILNGAECEPYLTCDQHLMLEKSDGIIEGLKMIMRLTGAPKAYIGIESNKTGAALALEKTLNDKKYDSLDVEVVMLKTKYPQGAEKSLIKSILGREVPPGGLPFDVGCVVNNIGTAFAVYEAVFKGKPLYERVITIAGSCLRAPSNLRVRIGTPVKSLAEACGGFVKDVRKIVSGGPMMGLTQLSADTPVIKGTSGILFLSGEETTEYTESACIRCARCVDVCPMNLLPADIMRFSKLKKYEGIDRYNVEDCIECGSCSFECPSKIPLFQWIKLAKTEIISRKSAK